MSEKDLKVKLKGDLSELTMPVEQLEVEVGNVEREVIDLWGDARETFGEVDVRIRQKILELQGLRTSSEMVAKEVKLTVAAAMGMIHAVISVFRGVLSLMGETLDPIWDMIFSVITTIVTTIMAAASALAAGIITAPLAVVLYGVAAAFSIAGTIAATAGMTEAQAQLSGAQSIIGSMNSILL